jgi:hypothetical protein
VSVNKMAEEGYTTIFHPGEEGVTIHKPGTVSIATTEPPILQGCKPKGAKLWTISAEEKSMKEQAHQAYNLPLISKMVRYLHAAAGFPVEEMWIKAIKVGNFNTWPTITPSTVQRNFPESDETQKGHMKRQCQGVQSTRVQDEMELNVPVIPKARDVYIKTSNAMETMHSNQTGQFPATSRKGNQYVMVLVEVDGNFIDAEPMKKQIQGSND